MISIKIYHFVKKLWAQVVIICATTLIYKDLGGLYSCQRNPHFYIVIAYKILSSVFQQLEMETESSKG